MERLFQWETYEGVLEGVPDQAINRSMLEGFIAKAKRLLHVDATYLIIPKERLYQGSRKMIAELPRITCMAKLTFHHPIHNEEMECSRLGLIWLQTTYAMPIEKHILAAIANLDWKVVSEDAYL